MNLSIELIRWFSGAGSWQQKHDDSVLRVAGPMSEVIRNEELGMIGSADRCSLVKNSVGTAM